MQRNDVGTDRLCSFFSWIEYWCLYMYALWRKLVDLKKENHYSSQYSRMIPVHLSPA